MKHRRALFRRGLLHSPTFTPHYCHEDFNSEIFAATAVPTISTFRRQLTLLGLPVAFASSPPCVILIETRKCKRCVHGECFTLEMYKCTRRRL